MELINCPKCGRLFTRATHPICDSCHKAEEELFDTVKAYLDEHPNCKLDELSRETGASIKKITRYLKEGRLEISKGMSGQLRCEQCNAPITSGRYCEKCVIEINQSVDKLFGSNGRTRSGKPMPTDSKGSFKWFDK